jgi:hypothetical protein
MSTQQKKINIFLENPYDVQCILEGMKIAKAKNKELIYMDRLLATLRLDPEGDIINISYRILMDLNLLNLETTI